MAEEQRKADAIVILFLFIACAITGVAFWKVFL